MCEEQNGKDSVDISQEVDNLWGTIKEPIEKIVELVKYFAEQITTMIQPLLDLWLPNYRSCEGEASENLSFGGSR